MLHPAPKPAPRDPEARRRAQMERARTRVREAAKRYAATRKRKPLRTRPERKQRRFAEAFHSPEFVGFVKSLGCAAPGCRRTDIKCAHVDRPRSRGGRWYEIAPLCAGHHREQEKRTRAFDAKYGTNLANVAAAVAQRFMERHR